jgi:hypothetical protein
MAFDRLVVVSGRRGSNPRLQPWEGCTLPLSYSRSMPIPRPLGARAAFSAWQWYGSARGSAAWGVGLYGVRHQEHRGCGDGPEEDQRPERKGRLPRAHMRGRDQPKTLKITEGHELRHPYAHPYSGWESEHAEAACHHPPRTTRWWRVDEPRKCQQTSCRRCTDQRAHPPREPRLRERLAGRVSTCGATSARVQIHDARRLTEYGHPEADGNPEGNRRHSDDRSDPQPHRPPILLRGFWPRCNLQAAAGRHRVVTIGGSGRGMLRP